MAGVNLSNSEAEALLAMEKHRVNNDRLAFPTAGQEQRIQLQSVDKREAFWLDLRRGRISLRKITMQNRARQVVVLARLDLSGAPHRNPDGEEIATPHLHVYREGYGDKWARPVPADKFTDLEDLRKTLNEFMRYCNITKPPKIQWDLL